jgi:RNA polymerase sigma factor (sigma-70 family)
MTDDEALAAATHDPDAFAVFYRRHAAGLLAFLVRRLGGEVELAADVCAETFATALIDARRFDPALGPAVGWLYGIARHKLADAQRRGVAEARARERLGIPRMHLTDAAIERIEALIDLTAIPLLEELEELPPEQRDAVRARVIAERSYAEIAREQRTSEANVRQRVARGLARLRVRIGGAE